MTKDIDEMENMLNDYLHLQNMTKENTEKVSLKDLFLIIEKNKIQI